MKLKLSFRLIVTLLSIIAAIILGGVRIIDPQIVEVMRLKYFRVMRLKDGEKSLRRLNAPSHSIDAQSRTFWPDRTLRGSSSDL